MSVHAIPHLGRVLRVNRDAVDRVRVSRKGGRCHVSDFHGGTAGLLVFLLLFLAHGVVVDVVVTATPDLPESPSCVCVCVFACDNWKEACVCDK